MFGDPSHESSVSDGLAVVESHLEIEIARPICHIMLGGGEDALGISRGRVCKLARARSFDGDLVEGEVFLGRQATSKRDHTYNWASASMSSP